MTTFDRAALAVVDGREDDLRAMLAEEPELVRARSDDEFRAPLLHYVAANGVPNELQRSPANAVAICEALLEAGAEPDATSGAYGGGSGSTALCLLVSSWHPFEREVQSNLVHALVGGGARVNGPRDDGAPLATALVFGYTSAAEALREAGARVDNVFFAAGLGEVELLERLLASENPRGTYSPPIAKEPLDGELVQEALHFAVTHGRLDAAELLLARGADVNGRTTGHHCSLPLLQAAFVHEVAAATWLLDRDADPDLACEKRGASAREHVREHGPAGLAARLS